MSTLNRISRVPARATPSLPAMVLQRRLRATTRAVRGAAFALVATLLVSAPAAQAQGTFDLVAEQARALAAQPYRAPAKVLPAELAALQYDGHRDIRFKPERALWRQDGLPFEVMFFHPGWLFDAPVRIHEVTPQGTRELTVAADDFDYGRNKLNPSSWPKLGFAGFRVHYPLNSDKYKDELVVFLGASYFRALGQGQRYGLSARGLALDTVDRPNRPEGVQYTGEEFPRFSQFWLEKPAAGADRLTIHALLESPRATGAYTFVIVPGESTVMEVRSRIFLRAGVTTLGLAPLTSMFLHGENQQDAGDFRPEVHDSDGLQVLTGDGEWIWRPVINPHFARPRGTITTSFATTDPRGFGLMQRDRAFLRYEDLEARYELRPSAWIEPIGQWGAGRVELVQLPTDEEIHDNIVAYWKPDVMPASGQPLEIAYRLSWQKAREARAPSSWVTQTRRGRSYGRLAAGEEKFVIDFAGPGLDALPADATVEPVVDVGPNAKVLEAVAYRNDAVGGWRLTLRVQRTDLPAYATNTASADFTVPPTQPAPLELRAFLRHQKDTVSETWTYLHPTH
jgi:periplasmic glucans biosynthesis protein